MDRQQLGLLAVMGFAFLFMIGVAFYYSNVKGDGSGIASSPIPADGPLKKFRAKPGTQRENARALYSSREEAPENPQTPSYRGESAKAWGTFDAPPPPRSLDENLQDSSPEEALELAEAALEDDTISSAERHAAMAYALSRQYPVDMEAIETKFKEARALVSDEDERQAVLYFLCKARLELGDYAGLTKALSEAPPEWLRPGPRSLEIGIMRAYAVEHANDTAAAQAAYLWVLEAAQVWEALQDPRSEGVYRQAGRRLARLYRREGDVERAVSTTERMQVALSFRDSPRAVEWSTREKIAVR